MFEQEKTGGSSEAQGATRTTPEIILPEEHAIKVAVAPPPTAPASAVPPSTNASSTSKASSNPGRFKYLGNYEIFKTIGEGSFAKVRLAVHRLTNQKVAIKVIDKDKLPDEYSVRNLHREAQIMKLLDHPCIIQLYEVIETKKELCLVLEYAGGGEVLEYIVAHGRLRESEARRFVRQIVSALEHCHCVNVIHRDLKAENLLLDENLNIKITDFGLSNLYDSAKTLSTCCGSPVYSAPELIEGKRYVGPEVDAWSLGVNIYAMVVGDLPFADSSLTHLYDSILKARYVLPDYLSAECKDLISRLLMTNPKRRMTISEVREHAWLNIGYRPLKPWGKSVTFKPVDASSLDRDILDRMNSTMGFDIAATTEAVLDNRCDQMSATYFLLQMQKVKEAHRQRTEAVKKEMEGRQAQLQAQAHPTTRGRAQSFSVPDSGSMSGGGTSPTAATFQPKMGVIPADDVLAPTNAMMALNAASRQLQQQQQQPPPQPQSQQPSYAIPNTPVAMYLNTPLTPSHFFQTTPIETSNPPQLSNNNTSKASSASPSDILTVPGGNGTTNNTSAVYPITPQSLKSPRPAAELRTSDSSVTNTDSSHGSIPTSSQDAATRRKEPSVSATVGHSVGSASADRRSPAASHMDDIEAGRSRSRSPEMVIAARSRDTSRDDHQDKRTGATGLSTGTTMTSTSPLAITPPSLQPSPQPGPVRSAAAGTTPAAVKGLMRRNTAEEAVWTEDVPAQATAPIRATKAYEQAQSNQQQQPQQRQQQNQYQPQQQQQHGSSSGASSRQNSIVLPPVAQPGRRYSQIDMPTISTSVGTTTTYGSQDNSVNVFAGGVGVGGMGRDGGGAGGGSGSMNGSRAGTGPQGIMTQSQSPTSETYFRSASPVRGQAPSTGFAMPRGSADLGRPAGGPFTSRPDAPSTSNSTAATTPTSTSPVSAKGSSPQGSPVSSASGMAPTSTATSTGPHTTGRRRGNTVDVGFVTPRDPLRQNMVEQQSSGMSGLPDVQEHPSLDAAAVTPSTSSSTTTTTTTQQAPPSSFNLVRPPPSRRKRRYSLDPSMASAASAASSSFGGPSVSVGSSNGSGINGSSGAGGVAGGFFFGPPTTSQQLDGGTGGGYGGVVVNPVGDRFNGLAPLPNVGAAVFGSSGGVSGSQQPSAKTSTSTMNAVPEVPVAMGASETDDDDGTGVFFLPSATSASTQQQQMPSSSVSMASSSSAAAAAAAVVALAVAGGGAAAGAMSGPRSVRFAFSPATTSTAPPDRIVDIVRSALDLHGVLYKQTAFLFLCVYKSTIKFEIEVCKVPRLPLHGLRMKKTAGDAWEYKDLLTKLIRDMNLT